MQNDVLEKEVVQSSWYCRVKKLFQKDPDTGFPHPKIVFVYQGILVGSISGFLIGGRIGARVGAIEHLETSQLTRYDNVTQAHREYHERVFLRFMRNGCRYGWRAGVFSGIYSLLAVTLSEVNSNYMGTCYVAAGAVTGIIYKSLSGWRSMVAAAMIGSGLSLPFAGLVGLASVIAPDMKDELLYGVVNPNKQVEDQITIIKDVENEESEDSTCNKFQSHDVNPCESEDT